MKPVVPTYNGNLQEWARSVTAYLTINEHIEQRTNPHPLQLVHQVGTPLAIASSDGLLMFDPMSQRPVYSYGGEWKTFDAQSSLQYTVDGAGDVVADINAMDFTGQEGAIGQCAQCPVNTSVTFYHDGSQYVYTGPRPASYGAGCPDTMASEYLAVVGVGEFITLTDTPDAYTPRPGDLVRVTDTGVVFGTATLANDITDEGDLAYVNNPSSDQPYGRQGSNWIAVPSKTVFDDHLADTANPHQTTYLKLDDTPLAYGAANDVAITTGSAMAWFTPKALWTIDDAPSDGNEYLRLDGNWTMPNRTRWRGNWIQQDYLRNDLVFDAPWTMVANKDTSDRAAPQLRDDSTWSLSDLPAWTADEAFAGIIHSGVEFTITQSIQMRSLQVWVPVLSSTTNYVLWSYEHPVGRPEEIIVQQMSEPLLSQGEWATVAVNAYDVYAGTVIGFFIHALDTGTSVAPGGTPADWLRGTNDNNVDPAVGGWNRTNDETLLRIHETTSDQPPQQIDMLGTIAGSKITFTSTTEPQRYITYTVQSDETVTGVTPNRVFSWTISGDFAEVGPLGAPNVGEITITSFVIPQGATTFAKELAGNVTVPAWAASVRGLYREGGFEQPWDASKEGNSFGVRLYADIYDVSPDWDVVSTIGSGSSGSGGGGGGVTTFEALTDTPVGYGAPGQYVSTDGVGNLLFSSPPGGVTTFLQLDDVLETQYPTHEGDLVRVNLAGTGLEFTPAPNLTGYVLKTGDTMTGALLIDMDGEQLKLQNGVGADLAWQVDANGDVWENFAGGNNVRFIYSTGQNLNLPTLVQINSGFSSYDVLRVTGADGHSGKLLKASIGTSDRFFMNPAGDVQHILTDLSESGTALRLRNTNPNIFGAQDRSGTVSDWTDDIVLAVEDDGATSLAGSLHMGNTDVTKAIYVNINRHPGVASGYRIRDDLGSIRSVVGVGVGGGLTIGNSALSTSYSTADEHLFADGPVVADGNGLHSISSSGYTGIFQQGTLNLAIANMDSIGNIEFRFGGNMQPDTVASIDSGGAIRANGAVYWSGEQGQLGVNSGNLRISNHNTDGGIQLRTNEANLLALAGATGIMTNIGTYNNTNTGTSNLVRVNNSGQFQRSTSLAAHKELVSTFKANGDSGEIIDSLDPIIYKSTIPDPGNEEQLYAGFTVENMIENYPIAVLESDPVDYDIKAVLALNTAELQSLRARVKQLEEQLNATTH